MKNFVKFERAYGALKSAKMAIESIPSYCISEYGIPTFSQQRRKNVNDINIAAEELRGWFKAHFPRTRLDAFHSEQFTFTGFFEMLKRHPELAKENKEELRGLLSDMRGGDLRTMGITEIPDISEFVE